MNIILTQRSHSLLPYPLQFPHFPNSCSDSGPLSPSGVCSENSPSPGSSRAARWAAGGASAASRVPLHSGRAASAAPRSPQPAFAVPCPSSAPPGTESPRTQRRLARAQRAAGSAAGAGPVTDMPPARLAPERRGAHRRPGRSRRSFPEKLTPPRAGRAAGARTLAAAARSPRALGRFACPSPRSDWIKWGLDGGRRGTVWLWQGSRKPWVIAVAGARLSLSVACNWY
nr:sodium/potassium-transporting ATPase subunit beta-1-interacting protein 2 isoform X5 [Oryctolagus cuniculus]